MMTRYVPAKVRSPLFRTLAALLVASMAWGCSADPTTGGDDTDARDTMTDGGSDVSTADAGDDISQSDSSDDTDTGPIECADGQVQCGDGCCEPEEAIELPVEVLGEEGLVVDRTFSLDEDEASAVTYLWMQVNNLSYQDKGSVRVNDGEWVDLNHNTVEMHWQEKARGGMVHGGFSTIRFRFETDDFQPGENTISFRFNRSDGISIGYRVVRFSLLDADSQDILPRSRFYNVDPDDWEAPLDDPQAVAEGEDLWRNAELWNHYLPNDRTGNWYDATIPSSRPIKASCADCHTQDGRDLEIFAYSNESIIERARFHKLTEQEGKKIASYIRSLSAEHENVGRYGRPWNPPYQPGPSVANRPVHEWAAGAGLDAVLNRDSDMIDYMFPNGVTEDAVANYFDSGAMEDHTTLPIALQLPDWKHWLPLIHPMDAYSDDGFYEDESVEYNPTRAHRELREFLEAKPIDERGKDELLRELNRYWIHYRRFLSQGSNNAQHWRTRDGSATTRGLYGERTVPKMEMAATSLGRLLAVKHFEVMNEFGLQDEATRLFDPADQPIERQWLGRDYQVFETPPHFTACFDDDNRCQHFNGQPIETGQFESTAWYHLQLILNGGQGQIKHNSPVDNNYHPEFILKASKSSDVLEPLRYYSSINAMWQTRTWTGATSPNDGRGMRIRIQGPWYFLAKEGDAMRNHFHGFDPGFFPAQLDEVAPGLTKWTLDTLWRNFVREVQRPANSLDGWDRYEGGNPSNTLDPKDKSSVVDVTERGPYTLGNGGPLWADHTFWAIRQSAEMGVDCEVLDEAIAWSEAAWPLIDFAQHRSRYTAYVTLRQESNGITAILGNEGNSPTLEWTVNGSPVSESGNQLPTNQYQPGDVVGVRLTSNAACLPSGRNTASAELDAQ